MIGDRLKEVREKAGISQTEMAERVSVSKQTLYKYENGIITNIPSDKIEKIAAICDVSPGYIMGWEGKKSQENSDEKTKSSNVLRIPVLGRVAAGVPIEMVDDVIDWEERRPDQLPKGKYFGLVIRGDSMEPRIHDKDVIIVRQQDDVESGDFAVVAIDGEDATCKRVMKYADGIMLMSLNSNYDPMQFTNEEITEKPVTILGKVVESVTKF